MSSEDDDSAYSDDDAPLTSLKKTAKKPAAAKKKTAVKPDPDAKKPASKKRKSTSSSSDSSKKKKVKTENGDKKPKALKKLEKPDRLQFAMQSFLWWDAQDPPPGCQWSTMEHAGVAFPEPYVPHGVKILYDGAEIDLTGPQEEA